MKPRHAAALALVGWYLMMPPENFPSSDEPISTAPLEQWHVWHSFDAADECERFKLSEENRLWATVLRAEPYTNAQTFARVFHLEMVDAECIASDDPRLKSN